MRQRRRGLGRIRRVLAATGLVLVLLLAVVLLVPGMRAGARAPVVLAEALGWSVPRPWAPRVERNEDEIAGVTVDRYSPGASAPRVLLVPGAARLGRGDPRVEQLATSLARAGREVVVPELALYQRELDPGDVDRVVRVARSLCAPGRNLVVVGFSYGGSLALVAAADDGIAGCLELVATFGSYVDLVGVVQAAATGVSLVEGERHRWQAGDPALARDALQRLAVELVPPDQRELLRRALQEGEEGPLPTAAAAIHRMLTAEDPQRVRTLAQRLPPAQRQLVEALSPVEVADDVEARVVAAHALDDPAVPYAELLRLRAVFPAAETMTVESFEHVDLSGGDVRALLPDLVSAAEFVREVLSAQEEWIWE